LSPCHLVIFIMNGTMNGEPQTLSAIPGRVRLHLPAWSGRGSHLLEQTIRQVAGVQRAEANSLTGNVLIHFDPRQTDPARIRSALVAAQPAADQGPDEAPETPPVFSEKQSGWVRRARIAVRGLDRDMRLARDVVDRLESHPGVHAHPSPLTGRVLVEYDESRTALEEILAEITHVELPGLPGEDRPLHPLDPQPLVQSVTRVVGTALGLGVLTARRLTGATGRPTGVKRAATAAGIIGILRSFPAIRTGLRRLMGLHTADLVFGAASIVALTFAASPLGLAVTGLEGLLLLSEVMARRSAWRRYEERLGGDATAVPGMEIRLEPGQRAPVAAVVIEGTGTAIGRDGLPVPVMPGSPLAAGARLSGGPFVVQLEGEAPFTPEPRPVHPPPTLYHHYVRVLGPAALGYAALTAVVTRSLAQTFKALLLVNPRPAIIGMEAANLNAAARVLRSGVTVVGTRRERAIRRPDVLLIDGPRVLTDGFEIASILPLRENLLPTQLLALAGGVSDAAGSPWGKVFPHARNTPATDGSFNGMWAAATVQGVRYILGPPEDPLWITEAVELRHRGGYMLVFAEEDGEQPLALLGLRPRLGAHVFDLVRTCRRYGVQLGLLPGGRPEAAQGIAQRAGVPLLADHDVVAMIRAGQKRGARIAVVSDNARAGPAFAACDLAIGISSGRSGLFPARADLLAADLYGVVAILEAGVRRDRAVQDAVGISLLSNVFGAVWGFWGQPGVERASLAVYAASLVALADGRLRLRGEHRSRSALAYLVDPRPERWGRRDPAAVFHALKTSARGLTSAQAARRRRAEPPATRRHDLVAGILEQLRSPVTGVLAGGAFLSLLAGETLDIAIIGATIALNVVMGAWQEHQAGQAAEALKRLGTARARVLRDGAVVTLPAGQVVPGDVLLLAAGDRVAADARLIEAQDLEVDEAALTGESVPVAKHPDEGGAESRIVLEGSDVVVGTGRAVVVAVGRHTRLGATAAALNLADPEQSPLGARLGRMLQLGLPLAAVGGGTVIAAGLLWGRPLLSQVSVGVSIALSVVPESLPLLAGTGQVGVARRLRSRHALLRRLSAVEALGRVDVACADKTGTMTVGRLSVGMVADAEQETGWPAVLEGGLRHVLLTAALASPHPDAPGAAAHPTDAAVVLAAREAGLGDELRQPRGEEAPFESARSYHAAVVGDRLRLKGAPEVLTPRCSRVRRDGLDQPLNESGREALLQRARHFADRGLRVLMVAEGTPQTPADNPRGLVALGFVGIRDPLRPTVPAAVRRCREAGVKVIMITGDHPATARAIGQEAGLLDHERQLVNGMDLCELEDEELDRRLEQATVIARATPLDKLRIIESLKRRGHTVAMTGDGVNDAPALRLADVGVAMGRDGTEVARQAADVVLADDDFATLVETFVEGRGFWGNMRRSLGLLLGGNLGELSLIVGSTALGFSSALNTRQILVVNLITDALPALSIVLQPPEHRNLATLAREGTSALDASLRRDVLRRGTATALPSLAAFLAAHRLVGPSQAGSVAFGTIVATQLSQTLDAGWTEESLNRPVLAAVAGSAGLLVSALTARPLRTLLGLTLPGPAGWALMGTGALAAVLLGRVLGAATGSNGPPPS
jgi:calcium-translocating P-type ATPase